MLRQLIRLILILTAVAAGYFWINPQKLDNTAYSQPLKNIQHQITTIPVTQNLGTVENVLGTTSQKVFQSLKTAKIPGDLIAPGELSEEIVVEDVVNNFTQDIKNLPQEQVKKIKQRLCEDVLIE